MEESLPMFGKMVDVPFADQFIKRNGIGVLRLPFSRDELDKLGVLSFLSLKTFYGRTR
jgi:hypothetical protein